MIDGSEFCMMPLELHSSYVIEKRNGTAPSESSDEYFILTSWLISYRFYEDGERVR